MLGNALKQKNHNVKISKITENNQNNEWVDWPDVVCFSVRTTPHLKSMVNWSKRFKDEFPKKRIWGGVHPSLFSKSIIQEGIADNVVIGPGEEILPEIIAGNLSSRKILQGKLTNPNNYEPAWDLIDNKQLQKYLFSEEHSLRGMNYGRNRIFYYIITSFGCGWSNCRFCYLSSLKKKWWGYSFDWVKNQINYLTDVLDIDGIGIWDDDFFNDFERAIKILKFLKKKDIMYYCEVRGSLLYSNESLIKFLKNTGCMQVFMGAESGSNAILRYIKKGITVETFKKVISLTAKYELPTRCSFIYGFPGETNAQAQETIDLIKFLKLNYPLISISGPKVYTPYPGTPLFNDCVKSGWNPPKSTTEWSEINRDSNIFEYPWIKLSHEIVNEFRSLKEN